MRMKKYMILWAALVVASACEKVPEQVRNDDDGIIRQTVTFTADAVATRTTLGDDWSVSWQEGDEVSILWKGGSAKANAHLEGAKARFSATVEEVSDYYAVYPADIPAAVGEDGKLTVLVPDIQTGKFEDCAIIVSHTTRESLDFGRFKSAVGMIRFTLEDDAFTRIRFSSTSEQNITGNVTTDAAVSAFSTQADNPSVEVPVNGKGTYYLATLPGISLSGLKFELGNDIAWKGEATNETPASIPAGNILCISSPVDGHIVVVGDFYITVEGAGNKDGSSAANAGDAAFLRTLLGTPANASILNGHTVHIAAGTYDLSSEGRGLVLAYGSATEIRLAGDPGTIFTTSLSGEEGRILTAGNQSNVNLTIEGITFTGASHNGAGGALCLLAGKHRVSGCTFSDNETTSTTNDQTGAGIYIGGTASADIRNCTFTGNKTKITGGAAIFIIAGTVNKVVGCTFRGNNPEMVANGGAILLKHSDCTLYLVDSSFDQNACTTNGPDLFGSKAQALIAWNCTFTGGTNKSAGNLGSIRINHPGFFGNCTFAMETVGTANGVLAFGLSSGNETTNQIFNNLILCNEGSSMGTASSTAKRGLTTYGHNVWLQAPNLTLTDKGGASDKTGVKTSDIWSALSPSEAGLLEWNGPAGVLEGFTCATPAEAETALKSFTLGGESFYEWLVDEGLFDKDARGNARGASWWPGSYQK